MRWSWYALPSLTSIILLIAIIVYLLSIKGDRRRNYLVLTSISFLIYSLGEFIERTCSYGLVNGHYVDYEIWLISTKMMGVGILMSMVFLTIFFVYFPTTIKGFKFLNARSMEAVMYIISIFLLYLILFTNLVIGSTPDIYETPGIGYGQSLGPVMKYLAVIALAIFTLIGLRLVLGYRKGDTWVKAQIKLMGMGMGAFILATVLTAVIPWIIGSDVFPLATAFIPLPIITTAYAIKKYRLFSFRSQEERREEITNYVNIEPGRAYLFFERRPYVSLKSFRKFVEGSRGLIVTSFPPSVLKENFHFEKTPFLWMSEEQYDTYSCSPYRLDFEIANSIIEFMKQGGVGVYIDSLHYLKMIYPAERVLEFAKLLVDIASENSCTLIASANPRGFDERDRELLRSIFDEVIEISSSGHFSRAKSMLYLASRDDMLKRERCTTVFSISNPKKIREKYPSVKKAHWISNIDKGDTISPERLDFELLDALYRDLRERENGSICICDLEYILRFNTLDKIMETLKKARDASVVKGLEFNVQVNPKVVDSSTLDTISSLFDSEIWASSDSE